MKRQKDSRPEQINRSLFRKIPGSGIAELKQ
jgi:hypothetical protein